MQKFRLFGITIIVIASFTSYIFSFSFLFKSKQVNDNEVNIAVVLPITGADSEIGNKVLQTLLLVLVNNINEKLHFIVYDTQSDTNNLSKIAKDIRSNKTKLIIGPINATHTQVLAKNLRDNNYAIPVLSFSNNIEALKIDSPTDNQHIFLLGYLIQNEITKILEFSLLETKKNATPLKIAIMAPDNLYGDVITSAATDFLAVNNLTAVKIVKYPAEEIRLTPYLQTLIPKDSLRTYLNRRDIIKENQFFEDPELGKITKAPPPELDFNVLLIVEYGKRLPYVTSLLASFDISAKNIIVVGPSAWGAASALQDDALQGAFFVSYKNNIVNTNFYKTYSSLYKESPSSIDTVAFDTINLVIKAVSDEGLQSSSSIAETLTILEYGNWAGVLGRFYLVKNGYSYREMIVRKIEDKLAKDY